MKNALTLVALCFLMTACGRRDADLARAVAGVWTQGPHTLTLAPDGNYISVFPGKPPVTYKGRWHIDHGCLVVTDVKSNSVPIPGNTTVKVVQVDNHHLEMALGKDRISMVR